MAKGHFISIRLLVPLPLVVDGGLTRWRIYLRYYGKNHSHACVIADCLTTHFEPVFFIDGRDENVERVPWGIGLEVKHGSLGHRILSKLVREGRAEIVSKPID